jgi:hypothetical protein
VTIALAAELGATALTPITALEQPIDGAPPVAVSDQQATVTMDRAIATFSVSRAVSERPRMAR